MDISKLRKQTALKDPLLTPAEVSAALGIDINTLHNWRREKEAGREPNYFKLAPGKEKEGD
jgi:transposase-like protein